MRCSGSYVLVPRCIEHYLCVICALCVACCMLCIVCLLRLHCVAIEYHVRIIMLCVVCCCVVLCVVVCCVREVVWLWVCTYCLK